MPNASPSPRGGGRPLFPQPHLQGPPLGHNQTPVNVSIGPPTSNAEAPNGMPPTGPQTLNNQFQPPTSNTVAGGMPPPQGQFHQGPPRLGMPPQPGIPTSTGIPPPQPGFAAQPARPMMGPQPGVVGPPSVTQPQYTPPGAPSQNSMYGGGGINQQFSGMGLQHQVCVFVKP